MSWCCGRCGRGGLLGEPKASKAKTFTTEDTEGHGEEEFQRGGRGGLRRLVGACRKTAKTKTFTTENTKSTESTEREWGRGDRVSGLLADSGCFGESGAPEMAGEADGEDAESDGRECKRELDPPEYLVDR